MAFLKPKTKQNGCNLNNEALNIFSTPLKQKVIAHVIAYDITDLINPRAHQQWVTNMGRISDWNFFLFIETTNVCLANRTQENIRNENKQKKFISL